MRFSWFGFRRVLKRTDDHGLQDLAAQSTSTAGSLDDVIGDMEALLIKALGLPSNINRMSFRQGDEWKQVGWDEREFYLAKVER